MVNSKVVVFGHKGFAGRNVMRELRRHNVAIVGASLSSGLDLRDEASTMVFLSQHQPTHILNCAAHVGSLNYVTEQAATIITDNSRMVLGMYGAVAKVCPQTLIINPIANCAYPAKAEIFQEDEFWNGQVHNSVLSYGTSRRLLLVVAECFAMQYGVRSINLLTPNMYGPFDSTDPNLAQNDGLSMKELIDIIQAKFNYGGKLAWDATKPDGAPKKVMDDSRFRQLFPDFRFTDFEIGIAETVKYYESIFPY